MPNHTSDEHPWFRAALAAGPGSPERARYLFREGRGPDGAEPPNDWVSNFGGPAWTRVTEPDGRPGSGTCTCSTPKQPDLDWTNPEVVAEFESILRFWLDRGVDGFRIDVAHGLAKDPDLPDLARRGTAPAARPRPSTRTGTATRCTRSTGVGARSSTSTPATGCFVAEAWVHDPERLAQLPARRRAAHGVQLQLPGRAVGRRGAPRGDRRDARRAAAVGAPATWVLSNHDVIRHATRLGGGDARRRGAAPGRPTLLTLALPGGAYVYQGEELGLEEVLDLPPRAAPGPDLRPRPDRRTTRCGLRDGCRVPLPWSGDAPPFGFGPGAAQPWLPQPAEWAELTVARQDGDPASMLDALPRRAGAATGPAGAGRRHDDLDRHGRPRTVLAFRRDPGFVCVVNVGEEPAAPLDAVRDGALLLSSVPLEADGRLPGTAAAWYVGLSAARRTGKGGP